MTNDHKKISMKEYVDFRIRYYENKFFQNQRMGQAFCNMFDLTYPALFYAPSHSDAINIILSEFVEIE